jgi:hypothetical protein
MAYMLSQIRTLFAVRVKTAKPLPNLIERYPDRLRVVDEPHAFHDIRRIDSKPSGRPSVPRQT